MAPVQSVERALSLLMEIGRQPAGLVELATRAHLPVSTASRLLATLEGAAAVRRDNDGSYDIGPAIHALATPVDPRQRLQALARPHLIAMSESLDEAACLSVVAGSEIVTVDQVDAPKPVQAENWTGTRVPLHAGGAGLVAMATWSDADVEHYLAGDLIACTEHTVTDPAELRSRIAEIRRTGVLWTHGEYVDGLSSASAAVVDATGRAVAVVYTYGPSYRYPARGQADRVAMAVREHADALSDELAATP